MFKGGQNGKRLCAYCDRKIRAGLNGDSLALMTLFARPHPLHEGAQTERLDGLSRSLTDVLLCLRIHSCKMTPA
jgi:hypothetical protein